MYEDFKLREFLKRSGNNLLYCTAETNMYDESCIVCRGYGNQEDKPSEYQPRLTKDINVYIKVLLTKEGKTETV